MSPTFRRRPSFATVVAMLALVVALGGTTYAAATINGANLQNNSVPGKKLKGNTVNGNKINESSLKQVPKAKTAKTVTSLPAGLVKATALGAINVRSASANIPNGQSALVVANCEAGEKRISGGGYFPNGESVAATVHLVSSYPDASGWASRGYNTSGTTQPFIGYILCLQAG